MTRLALLWLLALALATPAAAHPGAPYLIAVEEPAGPYVVTAWADPDTGEGTFLVDVQPDASLTVRVTPRDGHLPPSEHAATREGERLVARVPFDEVGPWEAVLILRGPAGEGSLARTVDVTPPGLEWWQTALLLLPFLAVGGLWVAGLRRQETDPSTRSSAADGDAAGEGAPGGRPGR